MGFLKNKLFLALSLAVTGALSLLCGSVLELGVLWGLYVATLANLGALGLIVEVFLSGQGGTRGAVLLPLKMILFLGAVGIGGHFVGNRVLLGVFNYVVQILLLGLFLKRSRRGFPR